MDRLQLARYDVGKPFQILSAHRCALHNARVGGAPLSQHLKLAVDIRASGHNRQDLLQACRKAGFTGFGFYTTFLHIDLGRPRQWWSSQIARDLWLT
ncbi:D-Ala-D-Ala carboxypeptidase family metallohydrolase [Litorimonas sp. WD9-15]|uniref:D-Ala-D-Ala carboxypeptidase family metallohydrolase n=1 Tax=Litorimonas sp. WD9-15 TaxID=3418716 RepID=UPI003D04E006